MYIRFTTQILFAFVLFGAFLFALHEAVAVTVVNTVEVKAMSGGTETTLSSSSQSAEAGRNGMDGADGRDGADGTNIGADGRSSVYVRSVINGVIVEEYGSTNAAVRNEESNMHSTLTGFAAVESPDDEYYAHVQELLAIVRLMLQAYVSEQL